MSVQVFTGKDITDNYASSVFFFFFLETKIQVWFSVKQEQPEPLCGEGKGPDCPHIKSSHRIDDIDWRCGKSRVGRNLEATSLLCILRAALQHFPL